MTESRPQPAPKRVIQEALGFVEEVLERTGSAIAAVDPELRVVYWNPLMEAVSGLPQRQAVGSPLLQLFPSARTNGDLQHIRRAVAGHQGRVIGPLFTTDGPENERRDWSVRYVPLQGAGRPAGAALVARRVLAPGEEDPAVRELESRFRTMADDAPVLLWLSGTDGLCFFFNKTWLDFTGRSMEEEYGVGWAEGVHFEDFQYCMTTYMDAFRARMAFEMTYRLRRHDGAYRWVLDRGTPRFTAAGEFVGFIGSCIDITELKETQDELRETADRLAASSQDLERFAWAASHDLQEPVRMVGTYVSMLDRDLGDTLDGQTRQYMRYAQEGVVRTREFIKGIQAVLDVRRISSERFTDVDLGVATRVAITALGSETEGVHLQVSDLPIVRGYRPHLVLLMLQLLRNAVTYRRDEDPKVTIGAERHGSEWHLTVRDNGVGLDMALAEQAFIIFKRLHAREDYLVNSTGQGNGIGLALCKQIVDLHGGRIWLRSAPGQGTTVAFTLPVAGDGSSMEA